ncbi:MAG: YcaO-like family protein [Thermodesulfobacteriota bacterium]
MLELRPCPKGYTADSDKTRPPAETVRAVTARFAASGADILSEVKRVDTGRLGVPVFLAVCGEDARRVMPTRKQMGKGASADQARASALMELAERYSFFSFWAYEDRFARLTWSQAAARYGEALIPVDEIIASVNDAASPEQAREILDLVRWRFAPALDIAQGREVFLPLDWFKKLNEFNGSSAGNSSEESILQGLCELVERHVCAVIDRERPTLPTIDPANCADPVLKELLDAFARNGIKVWLKDFTLGLPAPTVGALAYDPATFPARSEIVFTAGTASSPAKAAIRALTEVAQLAGDFSTGANYEASGLPKFTDPAQFAWLAAGPEVPLSSLPGFERPDILEELKLLATGLKAAGFPTYSVDTTHPGLGVAANYNLAPGFAFRERSPRASLGLFAGRILAEESYPEEARKGLDVIAEVYPDAPYLDFFEGLVALREEDLDRAAALFAVSEGAQEDDEDRALAAFYQAYALTRKERWAEAATHLDRAVALCPEVKEYFNLRGVAAFKDKNYAAAAQDFKAALDLDSGSAMDLANLGLCYKFMGDGPKALHCLGNALELDPSLDFARRHLEDILGG